MWGIELIDPANSLQPATMMGTDRVLDALACPPIDALNQAPRHPQSVPTGPGRRLATTTPGSLVAQTPPLAIQNDQFPPRFLRRSLTPTESSGRSLDSGALGRILGRGPKPTVCRDHNSFA